MAHLHVKVPRPKYILALVLAVTGIGMLLVGLLNFGLLNNSTSRSHNVIIEAALPTHGLIANDLAFSPDGRLLAAGGYGATGADYAVRVWALSDANKAPLLLKGHSGSISSLAFSPDGQELVSGSRDGTVRIWSLAAPQNAPQVLTTTSQVDAVAFSPGERKLIAAGGLDNLWLWDLSDVQHPVRIQNKPATTRAIAFDPSGTLIAFNGPSNTVRLVRVTSPTTDTRTLYGSGWEVHSIEFSPNGQDLVFGTGGGAILVWNLSSNQESPRTYSLLDKADQSNPDLGQMLGNIIHSVGYSSDGSLLFAASSKGTMQVWDSAQSDVPIATYAEGGPGLEAAAWSPSGNLAAIARGNSIRLLRIATSADN